MQRLPLGCCALLALSCHDCPTQPNLGGGWYAEQTGYAETKPALSGDTLYVVTGDGRLIARDAKTGAQLWASTIGTGRVRGANIVVAGAVVVSVVYHTAAVDAGTGALLWKYEAPIDSVDGRAPNPGSVVRSSLDATDSIAVIPAWGGTISAIGARTGDLRWRWQPGSTLPHRFGAQGVVVEDSTVYATVWHFLDTFGTTCEGWIVALDARSGAERWRTILPSQTVGVCVPGRPAVTSSTVSALTLNGELFGLDKGTGSIVWHLPQDTIQVGGVFNATISSASAFDDIIYSDAGTQRLRAVSARTGQVLWRAPYMGQVEFDMSVTASRIYAPDGVYLHVFDRSSGHLLRDLNQPGKTADGGFAGSVAADSTFIYAPVIGAIWAFRP